MRCDHILFIIYFNLDFPAQLKCKKEGKVSQTVTKYCKHAVVTYSKAG